MITDHRHLEDIVNVGRGTVPSSSNYGLIVPDFHMANCRISEVIIADIQES